MQQISYDTCTVADIIDTNYCATLFLRNKVKRIVKLVNYPEQRTYPRHYSPKSLKVTKLLSISTSLGASCIGRERSNKVEQIFNEPATKRPAIPWHNGKAASPKTVFTRRPGETFPFSAKKQRAFIFRSGAPLTGLRAVPRTAAN